MLPLPKPEPKAPWWVGNRWTPYEGAADRKGEPKGKGKGKTKTKSKTKQPWNGLPKPLQDRDNIGTDPHGRRLCFNYNLGKCDKAPASGQCSNGFHLCMRRGCQAPHPEAEHDKQADPPADPRKAP